MSDTLKPDGSGQEFKRVSALAFLNARGSALLSDAQENVILQDKQTSRIRYRCAVILPLAYVLIVLAALVLDRGNPVGRCSEIAIYMSMPLGCLGQIFAELIDQLLGFGYYLAILSGILQYVIVGLLIDRFRYQNRLERIRRLRAHESCVKCGYSLKKSRDGRCPECGELSLMGRKFGAIRTAQTLHRQGNDENFE